jgi:hypothetical protein
MKKLIISSAFLLTGLFIQVSAQKHPSPPPHPTKSELVKVKRQEIDKKYEIEKKLILEHPVATKQMKKDQMKALNKRHKADIRLLNAAK